MDAQPSCPPWCSKRRCTAASAPVNGHSVGTHRSRPEAAGLTEVYLVQTPAAPIPSVELVRSGRAVMEAGSVGAAIDDLLAQAGVGL
jgi:hypothetical protein